MKKTLIIGIICAAAVFVGMAGAQADIIYNNFGPGDTYITDNAWAIGWASDYDQGDAFVPTDTYTLDTIEFAMGLMSGTNQVDVWLMDDALGHPGSVIETFSFTDEMVGDSGSILLGTSVLNPTLNAGSLYWLIASAPVSDTSVGWFFSPSGEGLHAVRTGTDPWIIYDTTIAPADYTTLGAFRITGTPVSVPEPSTLLLLGTGLAGAALLRRRFRN